jgi:formylglycine-generating enzyme required for sulfatase activity
LGLFSKFHAFQLFNFMSSNMKSPSILLLIVAAVTMTFGVSSSTVYAQCPADLNGDGQINQADVAQLLANSGPVPFPPPAVAPIVPAWATLLEASPDPTVVTDANLRAAIVASGFAWRIRDTSSNIEMLLVPAGIFTMGCSPGDSECLGAEESPAHQVTLTNAFYIGKTEVTQAQWQAKMDSNPSYFGGQPSNPVEQVSWNMIQGFNTATGLRLPTEAEWEFACRAGTTTARYGELNDIAWNSGNSGGTTHAVATKLPNALGLYDTLGNVFEWCQDWMGAYSSGSVTNPTGPATGSYRVFRGGRFSDSSIACRASWRRDNTPVFNSRSSGFRVARNP